MIELPDMTFAVEILPAPKGKSLGFLTVNYPTLGTFQHEAEVLRCARHVKAPQIFIYVSPITGLLTAFEPIPLPGCKP